MANCERTLRAHTECVKSFLRDARTNDLNYAPGSYSDDDRCQFTRQAYVDCKHAPKEKVEKKVVPSLTSTQAQPLDFSNQKPAVGYMAKEATQIDVPLPALLGNKANKGPPPCEMELSMHGKCAESYLRNAMTKGTDYIWLSHDGEDKCFETRASFEKCMAAEKGPKDVSKMQPWEAKNWADHFSVVGPW